jgi:hypothetical protein
MSVSPQQFQLPREHGAIVCWPEWEVARAAIGLNRTALNGADADVQGMPLSRLREWTRNTLLDDAVRFTNRLSNGACSSDLALLSGRQLVVTGHQPELFHAGVWSKNFAAAGLARCCDGVGLNLIVDNDTLDSTRLRVPQGTTTAPFIERVAFDSDRPSQPWEEAVVADRHLFESFGERVGSIMRGDWSLNPLIETGWSAVTRNTDERLSLSERLAAVRIAVERSIGIENLELPMSRLCDSDPFRQFAAHLLAHLPRVNSIYNIAVHRYRLTHRLRSVSHPVPELAKLDEWYEAPFWIWSAGATHRARPFVRRVGSFLELRNDRNLLARWLQAEDGSADETVAVLARLARQGHRFRTRALTTTLFARLCLSDLFIHGIGGAKYDAMTDELCEQLFGIKAPVFATVSATFLLPLGLPLRHEGLSDERLVHLLRDLRFNPDRHIEAAPESSEAALIDEKRSLIQSLGDRRPTASETRRLSQINQLLHRQADSLRTAWQSERDAWRVRRGVEAIARDREFSWCLHSDEELVTKMKLAFGLTPLRKS